MYDHLIRQAFHTKILQQEHHDADTLVLNELGIQNGDFRADIAVLNGKLEGFEIKGEYDTLDRLPNQIKAYNSIFDKSSIIISKKFYDDCVEKIPSWWGIYIASQIESGEISFKRVRAAKLNKTIDAYSLAQLLWRDEAVEVALEYVDEKTIARARRHEVYTILADNMKAKDLSRVVISKLKARNRWRVSQ